MLFFKESKQDKSIPLIYSDKRIKKNSILAEYFPSLKNILKK